MEGALARVRKEVKRAALAAHDWPLAKADEDPPEVSLDNADRIVEQLPIDLGGASTAVQGILATVAADGIRVAAGQLGLADVDAMFDLANEDAIAFAERRAGELITGLEEVTRERVRVVITDAMREGWSNQRLAGILEDAYAFSPERALLIAQTETAIADVEGNMIVYRRNAVPMKRWITARDSRVSEHCRANEAQGAIPIDRLFSSGDMQVPAHPSCLVGETLIAAKGISKAYKRWFTGEVVVISISGKSMRITPNHPILTDKGWVAAGRLNRGDRIYQLVGWNVITRVAARHPDNDYVVAPIKDIADTLLVSCGVTTTSMPLTSEAFHGDGIANTEVDIVRADRYFPSQGSVNRLKDVVYPPFCFAHRLWRKCFSASNFASFFNRLSSASRSFVSLACPGFPRLRSSPASLNDIGIAYGPHWQSEVLPSSSEAGAMASNISRYIDGRLPGKVALVQIDKDIIREQFSGHVYNLETKGGYYFANSIIAHNCRCDIIPVYPDDELATAAGPLGQAR